MNSRMRLRRGLMVWGLLLSSYLGVTSSVNAEIISLNTNVSSELWQTIDNSEIEVQARKLSDSDLSGVSNKLKTSANHSFENARLMTLNENLMRDLLMLTNSNIAARSFHSSNQFDINLPLPNGSIVELSLIKDSVLPAKLAVKYPDINTYRVLSNNIVFGGKVDISPSGFHAMLQMLDGETVFIDPTELRNSQYGNSQYAIYNKSAQKSESHRQHSCGLNSELLTSNELDSLLSSSVPSLDFSARSTVLEGVSDLGARTVGSLKNYTIAIATTGEYSAKFGGSVDATMAAITTSLNRVNQILERDLGIHLNLAENNDLLINTDAASDPFTETTLLKLVYQNQDYIDSVIGNANYDIGHLFTTKGGGLAAIASICNNNSKAKGVSGITSPKGDTFDLSFVAHEIGHQLGATHTFNSSQGACSSETRTARTAFEPGSGTSIMSYAGYCGLDNIQSSTDAMYHIGSIKQIEDHTNNGNGSSCGVLTPSDNSPPTVNAGSDYVIPAGTPFELSGSAVDTDGDSLVYAWEQMDAGDASTESADTGNNALFRVYAPNSSNLRSFPPLKNILNNSSSKGETLPKYQRFLKMSFVAQDSFNVAQSDDMSVKVVRTGSRFALNYPRAQYARASTYPLYWNVANTDQSPVNCSSVDIWLSLDGGKKFIYPIATLVINNGETLVTIPADVPVSSQGRFKLKCSNNVFFAISSRNFFVTKDESSVGFKYDNEDQAETNLEDAPLTAETTATTTNLLNSSGGNFNMGLYLLLLFLTKIVIAIRRNTVERVSRIG